MLRHGCTRAETKDVGSISNWGRHDTSSTVTEQFFPKKKGISKNKKGTSFFIAKSWGQVPLVSLVPASMAETVMWRVYQLNYFVVVAS